jgi:hypothetical protein
LTWWGYLDDLNTPKLIDQKCGAILSYDNYTSNDDMIRRWQLNQNKYDVLIFSVTIYNAIKNQIILNKSSLWKVSKDYNPAIQKKYISSHLPHNIAYFSHALTGFLWNPAVIQLTKNDTVQTSFKKADNNKVILLDDPFEINLLLGAALSNNFDTPSNGITLEIFKKLTQNTKLFIGNTMNNIYLQKDFAFSYQWSGDAFSRSLDIKNYKFLINEHLSYITTDLIAQVQDTKAAACVAKVLASKEFLTEMQNSSRYFSPYGNMDSIPEGEFKETYRQFLKRLPSIHWLTPPSSDQLKKINQEWNEVKYELTQSRL